MRNMLTIYRPMLRVGVVSIFAVGALLSSATLIAAAPTYEVTSLGSSYPSTSPSGINDEGWVAGTFSNQASLFAGRLRTIKSGASSARAVNNNGEIVGSYTFPDPANNSVNITHAFRYRDTVNGPISEDLGSAANSTIANSNYSEAYGINTSGQVVGFASVRISSSPDTFEDHAFLYTDKMRDLRLFVGMNSYAYDINDRGDIVGEFKTSDGISHAFLRAYQGPMDDVLLSIGAPSVARAVNKLGHVVGSYTKAGVTHAFLYADGKLIDLGVLGNDTKSEAFDINDQDQIVGYSSVVVSGSEVKRAFLYDGGMTDLSTSLGSASVSTLQTATAINNRGEIAAGTFNTSQGYVGYRLSAFQRVSLLEHPKLPWNHTPASGDYFGSTIALHGDTLVVGALGENGSKGAVYVYRFENGGWIEKQHLIAPNATTGDRFGSALAFDGTTLVIGAEGRNSLPVSSPQYLGRVLVYTLQNQRWTLSQELSVKDAAGGYGFGSSLALSSQTILVGASSGKGVAYVFTAINGQWTEQQKLSENVGYYSYTGYFGYAAAIGKSWLVVGGGDCSGDCSHYAFIYEWDGTIWKLAQKYLGSPISSAAIISDKSFVIGASLRSKFLLFERSDSNNAGPWMETETYAPPYSRGSGYYDFPAAAVAVDGGFLVYGQREDSQKGDYAGALSLYERVGPYWIDRIKFTPSDVQAWYRFGYTVAMSGNTVAVGTLNNAVYVYSVCPSACPDIFSADLALNVTASADKAPVLGNVALSIAVTNNDATNTANGVTVEFRSPSASYVSGPPECSNALDKTVCRVASLGPGASTTFDISLTAPGVTGTMVTEVVVKTTGPDPNPANNAQTVTTEITPLGDPSIKITGLTHLSADKTTLALTEDDTVSVSFVLGSIQLSSSGNKVAVQFDQDLVANQASSAPVVIDPARFSAGPHTVTVMVLKANGIEIVRDSVSFTVKLLVPGLILKRPQNDDVIECGLNETVLMDYLAPNWPISPGGKYLDVVLDNKSTPHDNPKLQAQVNLCDSPAGPHVLELRLVNAAGEQRQSVTAAFTVRRVSPSVVLTVPKEGGRYLRGFDMVYEFVHLTLGTHALLILNDGPPQTLPVNSRSLAIAAEQLLPEKNHIVLQLFDGDTPLPSIERVFYVQDAASDAPATSAKSGGGGLDVLMLVWMVVLGIKKAIHPGARRMIIRSGVALITTMGTLLTPATLYAAPAYEITYLGANFPPSGINDEGWVAGTSSGQATLFAGRLRTIKTGTSSARAVNNNGEIVGSYTFTDPANSSVYITHAFRHRDTVNGPISEDLGSATNSAIANSNYSEAYGINTRSQVVGYARVQVASSPVKYEDHAFLYNDHMIDLALFAGLDNYAYDINDRGDIVGESRTSDRVPHAFLRTNDGQMNQDLPLIGTSSVARAVNNLGHVVGNYTKDGVTHAFLFAGGSLKDLGALPGDTASYALDINDHDQIVGYSVSASGVQRAFLYDGAMTDLSTTVETGSTITLQAATAINNKGEIVGHNANVYSYRLSATPRVEFLEHPKLPWNYLPASGDYFGSTLALHGTTLVVGVPGESGGKGAVYLYRFENGGWIEKQHLTAPNATTSDHFGGALAFDGTTLVITASGRNSAPSAASPVNSGSVLIYSLQNQQWTFTQEVAATDAANGDRFGDSIALFEQTLLVGTAKNAAYIFAANNGQWTQLPKLTSASSGASLNALAVRNNTLVLGSGRSCNDCKTLFDIYERNGGTWKLTQSIGVYALYAWTMNAVVLTDTQIALGNYYGTSVDIYERSGVDPAVPWIRTDSINRIFSSVYGSGDLQGLGSSLAGSGDQLVIGAAFLSRYNTAGAAYLYERVGPYWVDRKKITPREPQNGNMFGHAIAISGNTVAVGTNFATGSAHVFSLCVSACTDIFSADVAVSVIAKADKVPVLGKVTLQVAVTNNDTANTANGVMLDFSALNASYVSLPADCVNLVGKTVCRVGSLGPGVSKTFDITLTAPGTTRDMVTDVLVKTSGPDPKPANNAQTITTVVTSIGDPAITITGLTHMSADKTTLVLAEDDTASVSFELRSVQLSANGNKVAVDLDAIGVSDKASSLPVDVGPFSAGPHTVTVRVHDAQGTTLARDSISFTVRLLVPGLILKRPQNNEPIECGLNESVLMDYLTPNWPIAPNGKSIVVIRDQVTSQHYTALEPMDLCTLSEGEHVLELRLVNAAGVVKQSVTAAFIVRRVLPNVELTLPKEGGRYLRGFDMLYEFVHTTPTTHALLILNDGPPQTVNVNSRSQAIAADQLLPEKNHIVLQLFDGDTPLPQVERVFYVQDAVSDASATSTKSGGGGLDVLVLMWMVLVLLFRLHSGDGVLKMFVGRNIQMQMKHRKYRVWSAITLFVLSSAVAQAGEYRITDLGYFDPLSINDKGWVAGTGTSSGQASLFAGRLRTVQTGSSIARAINEKGQIAGTHPFTYQDSGNATVTANRAFRYADTSQGPVIDELGVLPNADTSEAFGINSLGHVVGYARVQTSATPVIWEEHAFLYADVLHDLGTFKIVGNVNTGSVGARAYAINDNGDIVGRYEKSDKTQYAFLISKTIPSTLPKLNGAQSVARAVNSGGLIVGWYVTSKGETHGFLYNPGSAENPDDDILTELPPLTGDTKSDAFDINDQGQIVGYSSSTSNGVETRRAVIYENGVPKELTPLLTTTTGWTLQTATAINNNSEIAGAGWYPGSGIRGYRLSPQQPMSLFEYPRLPEGRFPGATDNFGQAVAISGDTMVVGAYGENGNKGAAYIYTFVAGAWKETQRLAIPDAASGTYFGYSVAIDGSTLVVGAYGRSTATVSQRGAAFIYERTGNRWGLTQEIVPQDALGTDSDFFGWSVAIHNKTIVLGTGSGGYGPAVYVFTMVNGQWTEQQKLSTAESEAVYFGRALAINDDTIVISGLICPGFCKEYVYIYRRVGATWSQVQRIDGADWDGVSAVKVLNNRIFISSNYSTVDIYEPALLGAPTPWILADQVAPFGEKAANITSAFAFGNSIAMDGDLLLVGAPSGGLNDATSPYSGSGSVYIYQHVGPYWVDRKVLTASDAQGSRQFGYAVALSGNSAVVGTSFGSGAAYAYAVCSSKCQDIYTADLLLTITPPTPNKVAAFGVVNYRLKATNLDPANTANNVQVTLAIPNLATFDSASSQCSATFGNVVCGLGSLAPGATVTLDVSFAAPPLAGEMTQSARISAVGPDPDSTNSNVTVVTEVTPPGAPQVRILTPTRDGVTRFEGDDIKLEFRVDSVLLSKGGNGVEVEWEGTKARYFSQAPVSLGEASAGTHSVKVLVRDNQNTILAQTEMTFDVKVVTPSVVIDYPKQDDSIPCDGTPISPRFSVRVMPAGKMLELLVGEQLQMSAASAGQLSLDLCALPQEQEHVLTLRMVGAGNTSAYSASVKFRVVQAHPDIKLWVPRDSGLYSRSTFEMTYTASHYKSNTRVELRINGNAPITLKPEDSTFMPPPEQLLAGSNTLSVTLFDGDTASTPIERTFNVQDAPAEAPAKSGGGGVFDLLALGIGVVMLWRRGRNLRKQNFSTVRSRSQPGSPVVHPATYKSCCADRPPSRFLAHNFSHHSARSLHPCRCRKCASRLICLGLAPRIAVPLRATSPRDAASAKTPVNLE